MTQRIKNLALLTLWAAALVFLFTATSHCQSPLIQKPMVSIEFDDGLSSSLNGIAMFDAAGIPTSWCIITDSAHLNNVAGGYATDADVVAYAANPQHEVMNHTQSHPDMSTLTLAQQNAQFANAQTYLTNLLGKAPTQACLPFGHHNSNSVAAAINAGLQTDATVYGVTTPGSYDGGVYSWTDPWILPRYPFTITTSSNYMHSVIEFSISQSRWVIIVLHGVDTGSSSSINSSQISDLISYIQSKGTSVTLVTRSQGVAALGLTQIQK